MAAISHEERVAFPEAHVARVKEQLAAHKRPTVSPWWEGIYGTFANSSEYEEAMRLGREYRESLRPPDDFYD